MRHKASKGERLGIGETRRNQALRKILINAQRGECAGCGKQVSLRKEDPREATIDHVVARSAGGGDDFANLQVLCRTCNGAKSEAESAAANLRRPL